MRVWLILAAFILLQGVVLFAAVGCFLRQHRLAYYLSLYALPAVLALVVWLGGGEDWLVAMVIQTAFSAVYNLYISSSKIADQ